MHSASGAYPALRISSAVLALVLGVGPVAATPGLTQAQKFALVYKAAPGQVKRLASAGTVQVEANGQKLSLEFRQVDKITFARVATNGSITIEDVVESSQATVNGEAVGDDSDGARDTDTITFKPDGELTAFATTDMDRDQARRAARLFPATQPVFPANAVGVGDKWSRDLKGNDALGTRDARVESELLGFEDRGGAPCARIRMIYVETRGNRPLSVKGTVWVERSSGDKVASEFEVANLPLGDDDNLVSGTIRESRQSGGPLPGTPAPRPGDTVAAAPPKPSPKKIDDVVKDFEKIPGIVTLYRKREASGREVLYAELREDQIGRLMLLQATAGTGTTDQIEAGEPIDDLVFQFVWSPDERLFLSVPNWAHRAAPGSPAERAVRRSYPDAYLQAFKIEARQDERKAVLIDISDLFRGDLMRVTQAFSSPVLPGMQSAPGGPMVMDRDKTIVEAIRNFPENLTVTTRYHFLRGLNRPIGGTALADGRSAPLSVVFNLSALPVDNGYLPRIADGRIGYFTNEPYGLPSIQTFDKEDRQDLAVRYIHRFDLRKKNPKAAVSEPVQPLVFWLDNAIPVEHRGPIRDGLLFWNRALEKAGFRDAIQVRQMPDQPDPNDPTVPSDTADMRFNVVRWVAADDLDGAHAVAHARFNPLTGQVLSASITVTSSFVRFTRLERRDIVEPASTFTRVARGPSDAARRTASSAIRCEMSAGKRDAAWFGYQALSLLAPPAAPLVSEKEYIAQFLRETIAHEFGHLLGLRHNFAGSSQRTLAQLSAPESARIGTTASVMDYTPFNLLAIGHKGVPYFSPTLGEYDLWAIQYGYTPVPNARNPEDEKAVLGQIARRSGEPGHAYQSDEAADGFDPLVTRFDLSSDPLAFWERTLRASKTMLERLDKREPRYGEGYWEFTRSLMQLLNMTALGAGQATRYLGAQHIGRSYRGDANERPVLQVVDAAQQQRALNLLNAYLFAPGALQIPARYYGKLTVNPETFPSVPGEFPVGDWLANLQRSALRRIYSPLTLARIASNEFKVGGDPKKALTLLTLFESVRDRVWAETGTGKSVDTLRRQLQRQHVDLLIDLALRGGGPEDARMLAWADLRTLRGRIAKAQKAPGLSRYTQLHYADIDGRIRRTLDARTSFGSGGSTGSLLQMLMGGKVAPDVPEAP